jgi:outer membrane protein assembly factor BamB
MAPGSDVSTPRNHAAAFSASTGALLDWNPDVDDTVRAITVGPAGTVYLGGQFAHVHGVKRLKLAAVTPVLGSLKKWAPQANALVRALAITPNGATVYAGGDFTAINGHTRRHVAAISTSGPIRAWYAGTTSKPGRFTNVTAISLAGPRVYIGGNFAYVRGIPRLNSAAVTASSGSVLAWHAYTSTTILAIAHDDSRVYMGGRGSGGFFRAFDATTGALVWRGATDGDVQALYYRDGDLYAGGHFNTLRGVTRHHLAAVDPATGDVRAWNPSVDKSIGILGIGGDSGHVGVGGDFTVIGGRAQQDFGQFAG